MKKRKKPPPPPISKFAELPEGPEYARSQRNWMDLLTRLHCSPLLTDDEVAFLESCFDMQFCIVTSDRLFEIVENDRRTAEALKRFMYLAAKTIVEVPR